MEKKMRLAMLLIAAISLAAVGEASAVKRAFDTLVAPLLLAIPT
jgi:hypothetical protein